MDTSLIKSKLTCTEYLRSQGYTPSRTGRMVSPLRPGASNPTSFHVGDNFFYDFGSGTGGDVIDLAAQLEYGGDIGKAIRGLSQRLGLEINHPRTNAWHDAIQDLCNRTEFYHSKLTEDDRKYLHDRGFTDKTIDDVKIGRVTDGYLRGRLFLPYFKNDYVCYYATRAMPGGERPDSKYMKASLKESEFYENIPWGLPTLSRLNSDDNPAPGTLIISEGYFDALSWYQDGYAVLSAITGRFSRDQLSTVLSACRTADNVLIIYDNDAISHAGEGFTQSMAEWLFNNHIPFIVGETPEGIKDVNDFYAAGGCLKDLVDCAVPDLQYLSRNMDIEAFTKFILRMNRNTMFSVLHELVDKTEYSAETRKYLHRIIEKNPKEDTIAREVIASHRLCSVQGIGFYEWGGKVWERIEDTIVNRYVDHALGRNFTSNQQTKNISELIKKRVYIKDLEFNKKPVITFQNCVFDIETGTTHDFTPDDYCTIIMDYNYDPSAKSPEWDKFIHDVSNDVGQREEALQKIAGYVLCSDCHFQKFFILTGSGGNGKSVYTDILTELFGSRNVSHVEPRGLVEDFQAIKLKDSLLNIGSDVSSDFTRDNIREQLLKVSCGEPISACFKGKDFIDFSPRCKLIYNCNEIPRVTQTSGIDRRLIYIDFELSFVEAPDPDNPFQRQRDSGLKSRLLKELPGIFNWAYHGYLMLVNDGGFPETPEQSRNMTVMEESSNPVVAFVNESDYSGIVWRSAVWDDYLNFCTENGHKHLAQNRFHAKFRAALGSRLIWEKQIRADGYDQSTRVRAYNIAPAPKPIEPYYYPPDPAEQA